MSASQHRAFAAPLKTLADPFIDGLGGPKVQVHPLDWVELAAGERAPIDWLAQVRPTLVIAADVVYDPDLAPALATTIRTALEACEPGVNPIALVASTIRNDATYSAFLAALGTCYAVSFVTKRASH